MAFASRLIRQRLKKDFLRFSLLHRTTSVRCASSDDIPGSPFPVSPVERATAAKRYHMADADYEPFPDDGTGWGDYPMLPNIQDQDKDPHGDYDLMDERRNWGEPLHIDADWLVRTNPSIHETGNEAISLREKMLTFFFVMSTIAGLVFIGSKITVFPPIGPKQYPYNSLWVEKGGNPDEMPEQKNYVF